MGLAMIKMMRLAIEGTEKVGSEQNIEDNFRRNVVRSIKKGSHFKPNMNL